MKAGYQCQLCILLISVCQLGNSLAVPIVGGRIVSSVGSSTARYPFMVSLQDISFNGSISYQHFCGGSLISSRWILTAAHCVWRKKINKIVAFIGHENIEYVKKLEPYGLAIVEYIYFQPSNYRNDIALLQMKRDYYKPFGSDSPFARLPTEGMKPDKKKPCRIIGYGATQHAGPAQKQLFEADVSVISKRRCRKIIGHVWAPQKDDNTVCALGNNQDSCQGDSGGPLICSYGERDYIYGLVSHGLTCGITGMPSVYTVTRPYTDWVKLVMQRH